MNITLTSDNINEIFGYLSLNEIKNYCNSSKSQKNDICQAQSVKNYLINRFIPSFIHEYKDRNIDEIIEFIHLMDKNPYYIYNDVKYKDLVKTDKYKKYIIQKWISGNHMTEYFDFLMNEEMNNLIMMISVLYPIPETARHIVYESMYFRDTSNSIINRALSLGYTDNQVIKIIDTFADIVDVRGDITLLNYGRINLYKRYNPYDDDERIQRILSHSNYTTIIGDIDPYTGQELNIKPSLLLNSPYPKLFVRRYLNKLLQYDDFKSGYVNGTIVNTYFDDDHYWDSYIGLLFKPTVTDEELDRIVVDDISNLYSVIIGTENRTVINHYLPIYGNNDEDDYIVLGLVRSVFNTLGLEYSWWLWTMIINKISSKDKIMKFYDDAFRMLSISKSSMLETMVYLHSQGLMDRRSYIKHRIAFM